MRHISLLLLILSRSCLSTIVGRFVSTPLNLDILDLYYDFLQSNLGFVDQTILLGKVKSGGQCSLLCLENTMFRCNVFSYFSEEQSCLLMPMLNSNNRSASTYLFKRIPDCPDNFVYLASYNKCYRWIVGSWNWDDARKKCNGIQSHPLMTENSLELKAVNAFSSLSFGEAKVNYSICLAGIKLTWISLNMIKPNQMPFVWKPFQMKDGSEPYLPSSFVNWASGQPDNLGSVEFCAEMTNRFIVHDLSCDSLRCVICEIDV